jgi:hypothetical protein
MNATGTLVGGVVPALFLGLGTVPARPPPQDRRCGRTGWTKRRPRRRGRIQIAS